MRRCHRLAREMGSYLATAAEISRAEIVTSRAEIGRARARGGYVGAALGRLRAQRREVAIEVELAPYLPVTRTGSYNSSVSKCFVECGKL